ncbi:MAG: hypothetical protein JWO13_233 [Acidobacteriales bacterium]|nr:hypothetical protein [Terriglobales bacterium]
MLNRISISKARIEALSDGVFAIVMTLLVLELKVPDLPRKAPVNEIWLAIRHEGPMFLSFAVTFAISGAFWFMHQLSFHWIHRIDRKLTAINLLFLMFVSLLPFSTGMMGHFIGTSIGQMFYFGNALALGVFLNLHWIYAKRKDLLTKDSAEAASMEFFGKRIQAMPVAFGSALVLAYFSPDYSAFGAFGAIALQRIREKRNAVAAAKAAAK